MHATARDLNITRRLNAWLVALSVTGAPRMVPLGDTIARVGPDATIRWTLTPFATEYAGRYGDTAAAYMTTALLTADLFWPSGEIDHPRDLYQVLAAADDVKGAATRLALSVLDYSSDPASPSTVSDAYIQCTQVPEIRAFPRSNDFVRRSVLIPLTWHQADNDA